MIDDIVARIGEAATYGYMPHANRVALGDAAAEILSLRAELTEQARLVGMGAERELKLIAERDEARGEVAAIADWMLESASAMPVAVRLAVKDFAVAIAARAYVKENDGD